LRQGRNKAKEIEQVAQPEALATFAMAACNKGWTRGSEGVSATPETSGGPGDFAAEEEDAADIMGGSATGDIKRVDAAIAGHARTGTRAG
jgi:hypothetical protein